MHQHSRAANDDDRASTNTHERLAMNQFAYEHDSNGMHHHYFYVHKKAPLVIGRKFFRVQRVIHNFRRQFTPLEEGIFLLSLRSAVDERLTHVKNFIANNPPETLPVIVVVAASEWKNFSFTSDASVTISNVRRHKATSSADVRCRILLVFGERWFKQCRIDVDETQGHVGWLRFNWRNLSFFVPVPFRNNKKLSKIHRLRHWPKLLIDFANFLSGWLACVSKCYTVSRFIIVSTWPDTSHTQSASQSLFYDLQCVTWEEERKSRSRMVRERG